MLTTAAVLSFLARNEDRQIRVPATLLFASVVDNASVCVPIDHLYDPQMLAVTNANARVNLLGIVTVVAPWAYRENYRNLETLHRYMSGKIGSGSEFEKTRALLNNLKARLDYQQEKNGFNRVLDLPRNERDCYSYKNRWARDRLSYP